MTVVVRLPSFDTFVMVSSISKGMGHHNYGEPAWPNDILFVFPLVIFGVISILLSLSVGSTLNVSFAANPFCTPLELQPEWYFLPSFNLLRVLPDKFIGVLLELDLPYLVLIQPLFENIEVDQNPFRRPSFMCVFNTSVIYSCWLGIGSVSNLYLSIPLV
jgi:cytochrome b6-f complex subunit 4